MFNNYLKKSLSVTGFVVLSFLVPTSANAFSQAFVFGDSLSDAGRFFIASGGIAPLPPYDRRFSNGIVWVEYLQQSLGLTPTLATNFAIAGATTGNANTVNPLLPGIEQQVNGLLFASPIVDSNALYIIFGGANDYLGNQPINVGNSVGNIEDHITDLYAAGARNFLIPNLPNLGQLPATLSSPNSGNLSFLTQTHNNLLASTLDSLSQNLSDIEITSLDIFSLFADARNRPSEYGFTNINQACLTTIQNGIPVQPIQVCPNPNEYLFWDSIHPTTRGHQLISELALQALGVPEPSSLWGLFSLGLIGAELSLSKKR
jgi:phospholipase/lecithinase/hemolysin